MSVGLIFTQEYLTPCSAAEGPLQLFVRHKKNPVNAEASCIVFLLVTLLSFFEKNQVQPSPNLIERMKPAQELLLVRN